jgi:hypothetical protein
MVFASPSRRVKALDTTERQTFHREKEKEMNTRIALAAVAIGAALLGGAGFDVDTAPLAGADPGTDLDPLAQLYGDTGFNSWTTAADSYLVSNDPTLAASLGTGVENFLQGSFSCVDGYAYCADDPFTHLADSLDPSAFSNGLPDNGIGDLAVGLDYTTFSSGLGALLDDPIDLLFGYYFAL